MQAELERILSWDSLMGWLQSKPQGMVVGKCTYDGAQVLARYVAETLGVDRCRVQVRGIVEVYDAQGLQREAVADPPADLERLVTLIDAPEVTTTPFSSLQPPYLRQFAALTDSEQERDGTPLAAYVGIDLDDEDGEARSVAAPNDVEDEEEEQEDLTVADVLSKVLRIGLERILTCNGLRAWLHAKPRETVVDSFASHAHVWCSCLLHSKPQGMVAGGTSDKGKRVLAIYVAEMLRLDACGGCV
jgi:hypothetical protein